MKQLLQWTIIIPALSWILFFSGLIDNSSIFQIVASILLILSVMSAVHHSEIIAERVGEPYGTIILAISITVIEVSIIVSLMMSEGSEAASEPSDIIRETIIETSITVIDIAKIMVP